MRMKKSFGSIFGILLLISLWGAAPANAVVDIYEFKRDVDRIRYEQFIEEMRCPKCQNQNLSGSDSPIAADLRREIYLQLEDGRSDKEIVDYMVERYGEFILYKPRLSASTIFLWGFPVFLLVVGIIGLIVMVHRRRKVELTGELSEEERTRLNALLNNAPSDADEAPSNASSKQDKKS